MFYPSRLVRLARFEHSVVLAAYALIALVMSYPLVAQFGDHIPGVDGDVWSYLWAMGWARVSVLDVQTNPFHTDYIFYPLGGATQLLWGTALPSFASLPLQLAFGLVPAFNLVYLGASVLTAYGMYLLGKEVLSRIAPESQKLLVRAASFIAGLAFAFGALRLGYGIAFTNLFHTEFIPLYVLFLLLATRRGGYKNAVLAGLLFALNVYVDFQIAAFLAVVTGLWFLFLLVPAVTGQLQKYARARDALRVRDDPLMPYGRWGVMLLTAGILSLPMLGLVLNDFSIEGGNYIRVYPLRYSAERSYDALSYLVPHARSAMYAGVAPRVEGVNASVNTEGDTELSPDRQAFLGVAVLALACIGALRFRRALFFWIVLTLTFAILSLGPVLHAAGQNTNLPLPFVLANQIPILNHIRVPMRYGLMVFFGASLLAGVGALSLPPARAWLLLPLGALILLEAAILPYPTLEFHVPAVYDQIAQEGDDSTVLEIPSFNWRYAARNQVYQITHEKRILRAYTNRIAPDIADYFNLRQTPIVVRSLRILEGAEQGILTDAEIAQDREVVDATAEFFNLGYAVLHRDQLDAARAARIGEYLRKVMNASVFYQDAEVTGYRFASTGADARALELDLADNASLMYLGRGWQTEPLAEHAGERGRFLKPAESEIYVPSHFTGALTLRAFSNAAPQTPSLDLNGAPVGQLALSPNWEDYTLPLPAIVPEAFRLKHFQLHQTSAAGSAAISTIELR